MLVRTYFRHQGMDYIIVVGWLLYEVGKVIPLPRSVRMLPVSGYLFAFLSRQDILPCFLPGWWSRVRGTSFVYSSSTRVRRWCSRPRRVWCAWRCSESRQPISRLGYRERFLTFRLFPSTRGLACRESAWNQRVRLLRNIPLLAGSRPGRCRILRRQCIPLFPCVASLWH